MMIKMMMMMYASKTQVSVDEYFAYADSFPGIYIDLILFVLTLIRT